MEIILSVLLIILMCFTIYKLKHLHKIDKDTLNKNIEIFSVFFHELIHEKQEKTMYQFF